jgi:hypothetical protein
VEFQNTRTEVSSKISQKYTEKSGYGYLEHGLKLFPDSSVAPSLKKRITVKRKT